MTYCFQARPASPGRARTSHCAVQFPKSKPANPGVRINMAPLSAFTTRKSEICEKKHGHTDGTRTNTDGHGRTYGWAMPTSQKLLTLLCGILSECFNMRGFYPGRCPGLICSVLSERFNALVFYPDMRAVTLALREAGKIIDRSYPCLCHIAAYASKQ